MRKWPCVCENCLNFKFGSCKKSNQVGDWMFHQTKLTSLNHPKGLSPPVVEHEHETEYFEVEKIVAKHNVKNQEEYQIKWLGWSDEFNEWKTESELECPELVAKYEETL
jgi:hypothetical protein